jgi:hypothetical protein
LIQPSQLVNKSYTALVREQKEKGFRTHVFTYIECRFDSLYKIAFPSRADEKAVVVTKKCDDVRPTPDGDEETGPFKSYGVVEERRLETLWHLSYFRDETTLVLDGLVADPNIKLTDKSIVLDGTNEMKLDIP